MDRRCLWIGFWLLSGLAVCAPPAAVAQWVGPPPVETTPQWGYPVRYTLSHDFGEGPGYETGITRLQIMLPISEFDGSTLTFLDLQPLVDNYGNWGSNLGIGSRYYSYHLDRTFGLYGYFDYRNTSYNSFKQGVIGFDSLGNWLDVRANAYLPERGKSRLPLSVSAAPQFSGNSLFYGDYEQALLGGDFEIGLVAPPVWNTQSRWFGGGYYFDGDGDEDVTGWKFRVETHWASWFATDIAVTQDNYYGTSLTFGLVFNTVSESLASWKPSIPSMRRGSQRHLTSGAADRLAEPTHRLPSLAIRRAANTVSSGGGGLDFLHVVEGSTDGDGTFERPFGALEQALAVASPGQIVYTPYGGTYQPAQMLVIPDGVTLMSNAPLQMVESEWGWIQVPYSGASTDLVSAPIIYSSVYLRDNAELSGFRVVGTDTSLDKAGMITATGSSGIWITNNAVWSDLDGIWIDGGSDITLEANRIVQAAGDGIRLRDVSDSLVDGNVVMSAGDDGIGVVGGSNLQIADNGILNTTANGISITGAAGAIVNDNILTYTGAHGIEIVDSPSAMVFGNEIEEAALSGISVASDANADVVSNIIGRTGRHGIEIADAAGSTIVGNEIQDALGSGILLTNGANADVAGNTVFLSGGDGIHVDNGASISIIENYIVETLGSGINIGDGVSAQIINNQVGNAAIHGIEITDAQNAVLQANQIADVGQNGIWISDGAGAEVSNNTITYANGDGIGILNGTGARIHNNRIDWAGTSGIHLSNGTGATVTGNRVTEAVVGSGIIVTQGDNALVATNRIEGAGGDGIYLSGASLATINSNVIDKVGGRGIAVTNSTNVGIASNQVDFAGGAGIEITGVDYTGMLTNNVVQQAQLGLSIDLSGDFFATVSGNTFRDNRSVGMQLSAAGFDPDPANDDEISRVASNDFVGNAAEGLTMQLTGPKSSFIDVQDNIFTGNNMAGPNQYREATFTQDAGAGPLTVRFGGNQSYNQVGAGDFNFDFLNASVSGFTVQQTLNVGTRGSSDGTVTP